MLFTVVNRLYNAISNNNQMKKFNNCECLQTAKYCTVQIYNVTTREKSTPITTNKRPAYNNTNVYINTTTHTILSTISPKYHSHTK